MFYKILIIAPSWVGDMVMAQPLLSLLKQQNPNAIIDVLANKPLFPLLQCMPEINQSLALPFKHGELKLKERYRFARSFIKTNNYNQAIILPNSFKSALIPFFACIKQRTGWRGEMRYGLINDLRILDKNKLPLMVERFLALGLNRNAEIPQNFQTPKLHTSTENIRHTLKKLNLENINLKPILILCPGAEYGETKRWPAEYFGKIAKIKSEEGVEIVLLGGSKDIENAAQIQKYCDNACIDLTGKTSLAEAVDLISISSAVITNDSGLMHIAAALNRPLIAIFGSTSPKFTPPLSNTAHILTLNLSCSPCFKRSCPLGTLKCLWGLKPEMVLKILNNLPIKIKNTVL